ncbi:hypothetical protein SPRG_18053 [Saprolegnia parasitica CBS 223.65]|uniref:CBM1 domain-containing protein n=1 Tax=Saprolegnia parasitica (strain CBS 223.65) TaxID=695850 RepID=A0A067BQ16_SAPPC|nr:hypothetical protein SPRG_18053 [Saprolegnia parasitica CBS 223.65]KDO16421.1 hypothetical protein SPRG_18053 [Saprolegnia parasitica CBS 223.65]|eukprot:XP_012212870.1 hypothetical protein SPRG_18053 [Saprolegnia parasitica CBS 223.65]
MAAEAAMIEAWQQCGGKDWVNPGYPRCYTGLRCVFINDWYSQCQPGEQPNTLDKYAQCGGKGFDAKGKSCRMEDECKAINEYYSQCQTRMGMMDGQAGVVAVWQQCGGNGYKGDTSCTTGNECVKINDWYSQCKPAATAADRFATWAQCGGRNNNFQANGKKCRDEDKCEKYNDFFSQCIPK